MKIIDVAQGTDAWHAARAHCFTASEAPVMMSASSELRRNELLHMKATGSEREYSDWVQKNLFDKGHAYEAAARPIIERIIGEELYPITATDDDGWMLASYDGLTMLEDTAFEHKMWNEALAQAVRDQDLPAEYYWQLEQQLEVAKAERVIFVVSDGTEENMVWMEYRPAPGRAAQLRAGWKQFEEDLRTYVPAEAKPEAVGRKPDALPALRIEVTGMVTASNLEAFKTHALDVFDGINKELVTDQDFADAEKTVKWCKEVEDRLQAAKQHALSQTATIDDLFRTIDDISEVSRATRLELEKLVKAMKETRRLEIKSKAEAAFAEHIAAINKRLGKVQLPAVRADFAAVMKGKRTIATLEDAADSELARLKIEANAVAESIETNLASLRTMAANHAFLFSDAQQLVLKDNEALEAIIKGRIADHEAEEKAKAERLAEAERERIRKEERERLEKEQAEEQARDAEAKAKQKRIDDAAAAEQRRIEAAQAEQEAPAVPDAKESLSATRSDAPASSQPALVADRTPAAVTQRQAAPAAETVTIARDLYDELLHDQRLLRALEAVGVDNWSGWDAALDMLRKQAA